MSSSVLAHVTGRDRPGLTAGLMDVLHRAGATLDDIEQVVVRGRLTLDILVTVPDGSSCIKDLLFYAWERDVTVDFEVVPGDPTPTNETRAVVTLLGRDVGPEMFGGAASAIADGGGNIDRIYRLSRYPVVSYEMAVVGGDLDAMRSRLVEFAASHPVDVAIQPEGLGRRAKRLVVLDVDSTLIQNEVIDLLAEEAGVVAEVQGITAAAMAGDVDFEAALRQRVAMLEGLDAAALDRVRERIQLTPGARTFVRTLKRIGMQVGIVSGGFTVFTDELRERLGLDHAVANELEVVDGRLTGRVVGPIVDRKRKAAVLVEIAERSGIPLEQTVAVGDGANDLDMLAAAGLGIAFNAKPTVQEQADTAVSVPYLDAVLFLLGIKSEDVPKE